MREVDVVQLRVNVVDTLVVRAAQVLSNLLSKLGKLWAESLRDFLHHGFREPLFEQLPALVFVQGQGIDAHQLVRVEVTLHTVSLQASLIGRAEDEPGDFCEATLDSVDAVGDLVLRYLHVL